MYGRITPFTRLHVDQLSVGWRPENSPAETPDYSPDTGKNALSKYYCD